MNAEKTDGVDVDWLGHNYWAFLEAIPLRRSLREDEQLMVLSLRKAFPNLSALSDPELLLQSRQMNGATIRPKSRIEVI